MDEFFFSGSHNAKLDEKGRVVLPQSFRYGLVENGKLEFSVGLGLGSCLSIYRNSTILKIAQKFRQSQNVAKYQRFFTFFFSTLHQTSCDKIGRLLLPSRLKNTVKINKEVVIAGVLDKIEIWPKEIYEQGLNDLFSGKEDGLNFGSMSEEVFSLLNETEDETST
jgi:MraZ protein